MQVPLVYGMEVRVVCPLCRWEVSIGTGSGDPTGNLTNDVRLIACCHRKSVCDPQWNWTPEQQGFIREGK